MALQTQTYTTGDFAYKSWSNAYVLDLIVTEESADVAANTSLISYTLQLRSGANNRLTGRLGASVTINGSTVASNGSIGIEAAYNYTYTLLSGSTTVTHGSDGTLTLTASGNIWQAVSNSFAPPSMEVSGSMALTQIPRVSSPTVSPSPVAVPGGTLTIKTNRKSDAFTHTLTYAFGNLTGTIATNVGDSYKWDVPWELPSQIPNATTGYGAIACYTYHGNTLIGSDTENFSVYVPQGSVTLPTLNPVLTPVTDAPAAFAGLYIQGKSKVRVEMNASAWYASIKSCSMQVQGLSYSGASTMTSDLLLLSGSCNVSCSITDSRGYSNSASSSITVLEYAKPGVTRCSGLGSIVCCRCNEDGNANINGNRILLKARRKWSDLSGRNKCLLRYRIKAEGGSWSEWTTLLERTTSTNEIQTVLSDELEAKSSYQVQLSAVDDLGEENTVNVPIGTANTPLHLGRGGRNLGLGRYCDYSRTDAIDIGWDMFCDGSISCAGSISDVYIRTVYVSGNGSFAVQTKWAEFANDYAGRQSFFVFGSANGGQMIGTFTAHRTGEVGYYLPNGGSVVSEEANGKLIVNLPQNAWDWFVVMSPEPFWLSQE